MSVQPTDITPPRVPFLDQRTGLIDRRWYLWLLSLFKTQQGLDGVDLGPSPDAIGAVYQQMIDDLAQATVGAPYPQTDVSELEKRVAALEALPRAECPQPEAFAPSGLNYVLPPSEGGTGSSATPTDGQLLIGNGLGFTLDTLTQGANITITNGPGSIEIAGNAGTVTSIDVSGGTTGLTFSGGPITTSGTITMAGTLGAANGGTGLTSYAVGDLIYASAATTLSKLADVATGNALISGGVTTAPLWGKIGLTTHVSGTLPIANGGTNATTASAALANLNGADLNGATFVGTVVAPRFEIDGDFSFRLLAGNPVTNYASNDYWEYDRTGDRLFFRIGGTDILAATSAGVEVLVGGGMETIEVGAADSGGTGYRMLRVPN